MSLSGTNRRKGGEDEEAEEERDRTRQKSEIELVHVTHRMRQERARDTTLED
jgi:hypothetical protein